MPNEDLSYFQEDEFKQKLVLYEQMLQGGQSVYLEADELTDIAEYYLIHNEKGKAMDCIHYALEIHPGSIDPLIFLARQKMFDGDMEGARTIRDCITDQNDREVIFFNAELLLREGKEAEAEEYMEQIAEKESEDYAMYAYDTAVLFLDYGYLDLAARWGKKALEMEPDNEKFLRLKADFFIAANRLQEAVQLLDALLDRNPYDLNAWNSLGEAYFVGEDYPKAKESADFALAIDEHNAQALLLKANCMFQQQHYEAAHELYTRYFKEYNANEIPYLFDGVSLMAVGAYQDALDQLLLAENIAQGISSEQQHIYANLSEVYSKLGKPEKALEYIQKVKELLPDYDINLYKGHIMLENGRKEEGMACYDKYIQSSPTPADAHFFVGVSLTENKAYEEAIPHLNYTLLHASATNENRRKTYAYLSLCFLKTGQFMDFLSCLKTAIEKDPDGVEYTIGQYIPEEIEIKDFYQYVLAHADSFQRMGRQEKPDDAHERHRERRGDE